MSRFQPNRLRVVIVDEQELVRHAIRNILTVPDIPWGAILVLVIPLMAIGPLILYPFSKTLWVAIDLAFFHPLGITPGAGRPSR